MDLSDLIIKYLFLADRTTEATASKHGPSAEVDLHTETAERQRGPTESPAAAETDGSTSADDGSAISTAANVGTVWGSGR